MIKSSDLHAIWSAPDNTRLTSKQYSFRLPVHVAAKIAALCDLYPRKTRTEIVGDLLAAALQDLEAGLPVYEGDVVHHDPDEGEIREVYGPRIKYQDLARGHYAAIEKELGNDNPADLFGSPSKSRGED